MSRYFTAPDADSVDTLWENHGPYRDCTIVIRRTDIPGEHEGVLWRAMIAGLSLAGLLLRDDGEPPKLTPLQVHTAAAQGLIHDAVIAGDET